MPDITTTRRSNRPSGGLPHGLPARPPGPSGAVVPPVRLSAEVRLPARGAVPRRWRRRGHGGPPGATPEPPQLHRRLPARTRPIGCGPTGRPGFGWGDGRTSRRVSARDGGPCPPRVPRPLRARLPDRRLRRGDGRLSPRALPMAGAVAGVVALNGRMPKPSGRPLFQLECSPRPAGLHRPRHEQSGGPSRRSRRAIATVPFGRRGRATSRPTRRHTASTPTCSAT